MRTSLLALGLLVSGGIAQAKGDAENGKAVYAKRCEQCHGADGAGDPVVEGPPSPAAAEGGEDGDG